MDRLEVCGYVGVWVKACVYVRRKLWAARVSMCWTMAELTYFLRSVHGEEEEEEVGESASGIKTQHPSLSTNAQHYALIRPTTPSRSNSSICLSTRTAPVVG